MQSAHNTTTARRHAVRSQLANQGAWRPHGPEEDWCRKKAGHISDPPDVCPGSLFEASERGIDEIAQIEFLLVG
jgi:hypothetical protein